MKQTALEWFFDNLKSHFEHDGDLLEGVKMSFEQAKEMEKEQIMDAYNIGSYDMSLKEFRPEEYYNKYYKSE
jgi:hypothetical protein